MRVGYAVGGGVGNLVHCTSAIQAIRTLGHDLTVWVTCEWPEAEKFIDHDRVVTGEPLDGKDFDRLFVGPQATFVRNGQRMYPPTGEQSPLPWDSTPEVEINMWFARRLGYEGLTPVPHIRHATESPVDGEYVVIAPGVQRSDPVWLKKCYPHWGAVASKLFDNRMKVVFLGSANDSEAEFDRGVNLCGKLGLWDASGVLYKAKAVLAVDNGLSCISAALDVPTIVLWGPTSRIKNRKYGKHVMELRSGLECLPCQFTPGAQGYEGPPKMVECADPKCMAAIPPDAVLQALNHYLKLGV